MFATIRAFFAARGVMEVDTPLLSATTTTDRHLDSFETRYNGPGERSGQRLYLQTSPEFAMKRLLAAGCGSIYQLGKAFRNGEAGQWHNPEFTLLEWYRTGFGYVELMDEVEALAHALLPLPPAQRVTYREIFLRHGKIDPFTATPAALAAECAVFGIAGNDNEDRDFWLDMLMTHRVQPALRGGPPVFVHSFPASQAMLARLDPHDPSAAERFEFYIDGIEIANGYGELADADQVRQRLAAERQRRAGHGQPLLDVDPRLLAALAHGLPDCAGVAVGVDRLLMVALKAVRIDDVIAFPLNRA